MVKKISIIIILFLISVNVVFAQFENNTTSSGQNASSPEELEKIELIKKTLTQEDEIKAEYTKKETLAREMIEKGEVQINDSLAEENIPAEVVNNNKQENSQDVTGVYNDSLLKIILVLKILFGFLFLEFVMMIFLYYIVLKKEKV